MKHILNFCSLFLLFSFQNIYAQKETKQITVKEYINTYKNIAIQNMINYKIPASITMAQGILESSNGNSDLAILANNHFGIKCAKIWQGEKYYKDDDAKKECFRVYAEALDSYKDHSSFLRTRERYASLFLLDATDYKSWAYGLKNAGYATNPKYPQLLIKIIEDYKLYELDIMAQPQNNTNLPEEVDIKKIIDTVNYEIVSSNDDIRETFVNNNIKFVFAKRGDSFYKIALDFEMKPDELYRYNEFSSDYVLKEGEKVYLQPKRRKGSEEFHIVKPTETMLSISQLYGIKLKHLYKKNRMEEGTQAKVGEKLWLQRKKKD